MSKNAVNTNNSNNKITKSIIKPEAEYALDVQGETRTDDVTIRRLFDGRDQSISDIFNALINTLVDKELITRDDLMDNLNAIKIAELLTEDSKKDS